MKRKSTYKRKKNKNKKRSIKQKGGNLEIILPVVGVALAAATAGGVYAYRKKSNRNNNSYENENRNRNRKSKSDNNTMINNGQLNENIDPQQDKEALVFMNKIIIENLMLDKLQKKYEQGGIKSISIEEILLEGEQTEEKKYESLLEVAKEKNRIVSGYANTYISNFFYSYFLFCLSETENPNIKFSEFFDRDLKIGFISQLKDIHKTDDPLEKEIQIPDNIEEIFNKAQLQINIINSFIQDKNDIDVQEVIRYAEEYYITQYGNDIALKQFHDNMDLKSPKNFYEKIINKSKKLYF